MKVRRIVRRVLVASLVAAVFGAALLYGLADRTPADYRESLRRVTWLTELSERTGGKDHRRNFLKVYGDFSKYGGAGKSFTYHVTADEINLYLTTMDQIASLKSPKPLSPSTKLEQAGFSDPLVAMDDGVLTLMVWSIEYGKVVSVDLAFIFDEAGEMRLEILATRIGVLPVPKALLEDGLQKLRGKLQNLLGRVHDSADNSSEVIPTKDVVKLLRAMVDMLDGQAIRPKVPWRDIGGARHPLLITNVVITDGKLTLHFEPASD